MAALSVAKLFRNQSSNYKRMAAAMQRLKDDIPSAPPVILDEEQAPPSVMQDIDSGASPSTPIPSTLDDDKSVLEVNEEPVSIEEVKPGDDSGSMILHGDAVRRVFRVDNTSANSRYMLTLLSDNGIRNQLAVA
eukprot:scpid108960/ scgid14440/ 